RYTGLRFRVCPFMRRRPRSRLFPYTTLFRSALDFGRAHLAGQRAAPDELVELVLVWIEIAQRIGVLAEIGRADRFVAQSRSRPRSEEHTSELQSRENLVCRLLLEKKNNMNHE